MRAFIAILFLSAYFHSSNAQPYFDLLNVHGQLTRPLNPMEDDSTEVSTRFYSVDLFLPVRIKKDVLVFSPFVAEWQIENNSSKTINARTIALPIAFVKQWKNEKQKTNFVFIARTNHDPEDGLENSIQLGGLVLHTFKKQERLKFKFGLYYNTEFFGPYFRPLLGIDWKVNDKLSLFGVLPATLNLEYILSRRFRTGIALRTYTNSYRQANDTFIRIDDNYLKGFADIYITKKHVLIFEAGHSILRKYRTGYRSEGETEYQDLNVKDGYLLKIGYAYRFRLDSDY